MAGEAPPPSRRLATEDVDEYERGLEDGLTRHEFLPRTRDRAQATRYCVGYKEGLQVDLRPYDAAEQIEELFRAFATKPQLTAAEFSSYHRSVRIVLTDLVTRVRALEGGSPQLDLSKVHRLDARFVTSWGADGWQGRGSANFSALPR